MGSPNVIKAEESHIDIIAASMRTGDRMEVWAAGHLSPEVALRESLKNSPFAWTGLSHGTPVLMFGIAEVSALSTTGIPWLLTADGIKNVKLEFIRFSKYYVQQMRKHYCLLENYVDARYKDAVRWIEWCGFEIHPPEPYGPDDILFHRFTMKGV